MASKATTEIEEVYVPGAEMAVPYMGQRRHPQRPITATPKPMRESDFKAMVTGKPQPGRIRSLFHRG